MGTISGTKLTIQVVRIRKMTYSHWGVDYLTSHGWGMHLKSDDQTLIWKLQATKLENRYWPGLFLEEKFLFFIFLAWEKAERNP